MQKIHHNQRHHHFFKPDNPQCLAVALLVGLIGGALLITSSLRTTTTTTNSLSCGDARAAGSVQQLETIVHYATSRVVPQQSLEEIAESFKVLKTLGGACNFLVFGLGHDSMMWAALNPRGKTLFLEEDPKWVRTVLKSAPDLRADTVRYRTQLSQADELLRHHRDEPDCSPKRSFIRGNDKCRLALNMLSDEVYDTEWDVIMIDAPRGYFPEAPGRMAAIYSAAVMARNRKKSGATHVFLHDVDRKVEKTYADMFLCNKNLVHAVGRLYHFEIPPVANVSTSSSENFC